MLSARSAFAEDPGVTSLKNTPRKVAPQSDIKEKGAQLSTTGYDSGAWPAGHVPGTACVDDKGQTNGNDTLSPELIIRSGFEADTAFTGREDHDDYVTKGYVPTTTTDHDTARRGKESVSVTLDYAYDDWCMARMAHLLGKREDEKLFHMRSSNYRNLFDPETGLMRGKTAEGAFISPFDPKNCYRADYTESDAWQASFFVPHDPQGLIDLIGGDAAFIAKLDQLFSESSDMVHPQVDITGLIGQYSQGDEPDHHVPYFYSYAGVPWKTQERVRQIMKTLYTNKDDGLCGNDDCGQMSAWYVLSAIGFYPVNPADGIYVIGSPLVDRAVIPLDPRYYPGGTFTVVARENSPQNIYIQSATLNGKPLTRSYITHAELVQGGELVLQMGPKPNKEWGQEKSSRPPSGKL